MFTRVCSRDFFSDFSFCRSWKTDPLPLFPADPNHKVRVSSTTCKSYDHELTSFWHSVARDGRRPDRLFRILWIPTSYPNRLFPLLRSRVLDRHWFFRL